jgi:hypothetical protein
MIGNTRTKLDYDASLILHYIEKSGSIFISKNRYGKTGNISRDQLIIYLIRLIAHRSFKDFGTMFQSALEQDLIKAINGTLKNHAKKEVNIDDTI